MNRSQTSHDLVSYQLDETEEKHEPDVSVAHAVAASDIVSVCDISASSSSSSSSSSFVYVTSSDDVSESEPAQANQELCDIVLSLRHRLNLLRSVMAARDREIARQFARISHSITCYGEDSMCSADLRKAFTECYPLIDQSKNRIIETFRHTLRTYTALERSREEVFAISLSESLAKEDMLRVDLGHKIGDNNEARSLTPLQSRDAMRVAAHKNNFAKTIDTIRKRLESQQTRTKNLRADYRLRTKSARLARKQSIEDVATMLARISCLSTDIRSLDAMLRAQDSD